MSQIIYPITHLPPVIDIGKQTEKGVTRIGFDVHEWLDDWPGMVFSVQPTRPGETESYFAASEMVGSVVFWLVGAVDTEKPGSGTVEVLGVTEDERKLSFMCRTSIANTNTVTTAEIPEPNQPWVDRVILAADSAANSATDSAVSADKAAASAKEAAESVQDFFIVTAAPKKEGVPVLYADKTQEEIREAVAAGKTCLLVPRANTTLVSAGTVCPYFGEGKYDTNEAESPSFFAGVKYDTRYSLWYQYAAYVRADGHVGVTGNPIRTPAPQKLKLSGAVDATYDGSSAVTVEIPSGSLPETADPLKQLVTDKDGNVAWEDRLAYKYTTTEKGYAYVYQDAEMTVQDGQCLLPTPPVASPVAGETYTVIIGSNEYTSKCVDASALTNGLESYVFGNTAAMGDELSIENPDPDATYLILLMPGGSDGFYAAAVFDDPVDSPALTIRSTEEIETTTTNIKKADRELLDIPTPDMEAGVGEDGYIANRPCWVYEMPKDKFYNGPGVVWDGVIEGKEALYMTLNGETSLIGYKVCPVPMTEHTFYNKLAAWSRSYQYNADGTDAGHKIIATMELVTNGLTAIKQNTGNVLYYSFDADATGGSLAEFSGGGTGVYITPEYAAVAPHIVWATGYITKPLDVGMLPPAETVAGSQTVYYWRWSGASNQWQAVTIDQLKADLGLT